MNSGFLLIAGMFCKLPEWTTLGNYFLILNKGVDLSKVWKGKNRCSTVFPADFSLKLLKPPLNKFQYFDVL